MAHAIDAATTPDEGGLSPAGGASSPAVAASASSTWTARVVLVMIVAVVLLQRFLLPLGATPVQLTIFVVYGGVALLLVTGQLVIDRLRMELLGLAAVLCLTAALASTALGGSLALTSLGLLFVLYLVWTLKVGPGHQPTLRRVGNGFVNLMVLLSLVGVAQLATQLVGWWTYHDYIREFLPAQYTARSYNTSIPLVYGSSFYKANAFVFLEPSFLSQFAALGAITALVLRAPAWKLVVLVAGVLSAVSGTGVILLVVGAALVLVRGPWLIRGVHLVVLCLVGAAAALSPVTPLLLARVGEFSDQGTSGYLRFVQPYQEVLKALQEEPMRYLVGAGPGAVERLLPAARTGGEAVVYGIVPKLAFEYGLVAGGVFVLFIVLALLDRGAWRVVPGAVMVMIFVLSGSLLQPHTVFIAWMLTSLWTGQLGPRVDQLKVRGRGWAVDPISVDRSSALWEAERRQPTG